jgi:hypothetical protein
MGVFQTFVKVFNRAPVPLTVTFDGQEQNIPPGHFQIPDVTLAFAMNQNPIKGTQDPNNPAWDGAKYLIVPEDDPTYGAPLTEEEWIAIQKRPCRLDEIAAFQERYGNDPKAKLVTYGKDRTVNAGSRMEAGGVHRGTANFTNSETGF